MSKRPRRQKKQPKGNMTIVPSHFRTTIYTAAELRALPNLLFDVFCAINDAFDKHSSSGIDSPRFIQSGELVDLLGKEGLCAIIHSNDSILASASVIPWRPDKGGIVDSALKARPDDLVLVDKSLSYEVKAAITADTPESRGRGLVSVCIESLVSRFFTIHRGESELLLWVHLAEIQNGLYWRRRGYEQIGPTEIKPKGTWESKIDFEHSTLLKRVNSQSYGRETTVVRTTTSTPCIECNLPALKP
jgi:hypothetical protein